MNQLIRLKQILTVKIKYSRLYKADDLDSLQEQLKLVMQAILDIERSRDLYQTN